MIANLIKVKVLAVFRRNWHKDCESAIVTRNRQNGMVATVTFVKSVSLTNRGAHDVVAIAANHRTS